MLKKALETLYNESTLSTRELARRLDVSEETMKLILDELERRGYLVSRGMHCSRQCEGCPLRDDCLVSPGGKLWLLDREKTRKALEDR